MRTTELEVRDLRVAGAAMLGAAAVLPLLPGAPGLVCPLCGMTTSVESILQLRRGEAFAANPAGVAAVLVAVLLLVLRPSALRVPSVALPLGLAGMWAFELHRFGLF